MGSALLWHCPQSPVSWEGGLGLGAEPTAAPLLPLLVPELWAQREITLLVGTARLPPGNPEALGRSCSTLPAIISQPDPPRCESTRVTFMLDEFRVAN